MVDRNYGSGLKMWQLKGIHAVFECLLISSWMQQHDSLLMR
jgi:hypothetical protein